tara:strand:+ start:2610 stop:2957 length:348 start_codon:yes stop_codon:yes gene_type:complete
MPAKDFSCALKAKIKSEIDFYLTYMSSPVIESLVAYLLKIGLTLKVDNPDSGSNVCFAESEELRSEFRNSYTSTDLVNYIYADLNNAEQSDLMKITFPKSTAEFWALVAQGQTEN